MPMLRYRREDRQILVATWKDLGEGWSVVCTEKGLRLSRNGCVFPPDFIPSSDVFPEIPQSRKHEIRDAQWIVRRWKAVVAGKHSDAGWRIKGRCSRDYQVWLLREPHGFLDLSIEEIFEFFPFLQKLLSGKSASLALPLSFQRIGDLLFPEVYGPPENRKKRAADAHNRVESEFGRGTLKKKPKPDRSGPGPVLVRPLGFHV